jgi:hypothetical protein
MPQEMRVIVITSSPPVHLVLSFNGKPEISANTVCPDWTFLSLIQSLITNHQSPRIGMTSGKSIEQNALRVNLLRLEKNDILLNSLY